MPLIASAFASGLIFGLGLIVSQMVNPAKVIGFLDLFGRWDPSLAFVMGGAVAVSALGFAVARRRRVPLLAPRLEVPARRDLDPRLLAGAALFGIGWGLAGFCPGPALTMLLAGPWQVPVFVASMIAGMALFRVMPADWPEAAFRRRASEADG
ncbi:YeeE/YedE family protein [Microvirga thermotolerans]|uniref:YeeE/YedE family protein n=1 Tax=Microvirga thermotolerans TaxID=2651334 RepID=A0A5P9JYJ9_9HYPH|nr:YeeE/YedE family protein [Microvirga thermotolerans]QFU16716.1 YeeE/YedE family protein [Microvirga thermotolerans]